MPAKRFPLFHLLIPLLKVVNNFNHIYSFLSCTHESCFPEWATQTNCLSCPSVSEPASLFPPQTYYELTGWIHLCQTSLECTDTCLRHNISAKYSNQEIDSIRSELGLLCCLFPWRIEWVERWCRPCCSLTSSKRIFYLVMTGAGHNPCGTGRWKARYRNGHNSIGRHSRSWGEKIELCSNLTT